MTTLPLSSPLCELKSHYDVVIIGSGYGGAIAASRLARARRSDGTQPSVCVLERGREIPVGRFPSGALDAFTQFQIHARGKSQGAEDALYSLHTGTNISVLHGCGLGGSSLINAGVSLAPEPRVFEDARWPRALIEDLHDGLEAGFAQARQMLEPTPYPGTPALPKDAALQVASRALGAEASTYPPPLNVRFEAPPHGKNRFGVPQAACTGCGECVAGCNVGAKNTLAMNYLPDARAHGAELFCSVRVLRVEAPDAGSHELRVRYQPIGFDRETFGGGALFVSAGVVIVAAGVLGSIEILARSKEAGLGCSDALGEHVSGNGDLLGFAQGSAHEVHAVGVGKRSVDARRAPGPTISSVIDRRAGMPLTAAHVLQNGVIPSALAPLIPGLLSLTASAGDITAAGFWKSLRGVAELALLAPTRDAARALRNTQTFLVMSHDDSAGRVTLDGDSVRADWPRTSKAVLHDELRRASDALQAHYVSAPRNAEGEEQSITVHPLGGCVMGDDAQRAVTNHKGQVFAAGTGERVHEGLYVIDGSVIPCSLGVNPHLTIAAVAERNARMLARDRGWHVDDDDYDAKAAADGGKASQPNPDALRVHFSEKIEGYLSTEVLAEGAYLAAARDGQQRASPCKLVLTVATEDCQAMLDDPEHRAGIVGELRAPALSNEALTMSEGRFNLFVDQRDATIKHMRYRWRMHTVDGRTYYFEGHKHLDRGHDTLVPGVARLWRDTTTLLVSVHESHTGDSFERAVTRPKVAQGILYITASSFMKELLYMKGKTAAGSSSLRALLLYGAMFGAGLWQVYRPRLTSLRNWRGRPRNSTQA